jgi:hypothetical protein
VNGVLSSALGGAGQLTIPLVRGTSTFASADTASPLGPVTGTSFLSSEGTFFYANLTPVNSPNQREFVAGGLPVSANALAATGSTRIVAFTVQPDAALQSNIPFIRNNTGGNLANAYVSPLFLVAPANAAIGDANAGSRILQSSLAINGQGANQQSVLVTSIGSVLSLQSSGQPVSSGVVRGTSQLSPTAAPSHRLGLCFHRRRQRQQPLRSKFDLGFCFGSNEIQLGQRPADHAGDPIDGVRGHALGSGDQLRFQPAGDCRDPAHLGRREPHDPDPDGLFRRHHEHDRADAALRDRWRRLTEH